MKVHALRMGLAGLVVFRDLLEEPVVRALRSLLDADPNSEEETVYRYGAFAHALFEHTNNWSDYLLKKVLEDENLYVKALGRCEKEAEPFKSLLDHELAFLQALSLFDGSEIRAAISAPAVQWPGWRTKAYDFAGLYAERIRDIHKTGYGIFAKYHMFTVEAGQLVPVRYPDPQSLADLTGYERERRLVIANTEALLEGRPASNVLLYGDAGTGKSSTVKAVANAYKDRGLRLIELKKNQLYEIPAVVDQISDNPCRFILFIDDLSFSRNDNDFSALKAILEGSVSGRSQNLAIYATSNRRHLIKESVSDREGDDMHRTDTLQELMSLSARFGLTITFSRPDKELYLTIVSALAKQYGVDLDEDTLFLRAEAHAIRSGGRSPRVARQFVELLKAGVL